jgi:hypothetical protein
MPNGATWGFTPMGALAKKYHFATTSIAKMLRNEKYRGDLLLQKTFISDHLTKKKRSGICGTFNTLGK